MGGEEPEQAGGGERLHIRRQEGETMIVLSACLLFQTPCQGVLQPREVGCRVCGEKGRGGTMPRPTQALL